MEYIVDRSWPVGFVTKTLAAELRRGTSGTMTLSSVRNDHHSEPVFMSAEADAEPSEDLETAVLHFLVAHLNGYSVNIVRGAGTPEAESLLGFSVGRKGSFAIRDLLDIIAEASPEPDAEPEPSIYGSDFPAVDISMFYPEALVWKKGFHGKQIADAAGRPMYEVGQDDKGRWYWLHNWHGLAMLHVAGEAEAKAAAQDDYNTRTKNGGV